MRAALALLAVAAAASLSAWLGRPAAPFVSIAALLTTLLVGERALAGVAAAMRFRDPAALLFPVAHLARDGAWTLAIGVWLARRAVGIATRPAHSMRARGPASAAFSTPADER